MSSRQEAFRKRHQGSPAQASPLPKHLYHVTCQHTESPIFSSLPALKRWHPFETYTHFSGTEGKDTSDKEVLVNPLQLQGRANQEIN